MEHSRFMQVADHLSLDEPATENYLNNAQYLLREEQRKLEAQLSMPGFALQPATPFNSDFSIEMQQKVIPDIAAESLHVMSRGRAYSSSLYSCNEEEASEKDLDSIARTPSPSLSRISRISSPASSQRVRKPRAPKSAPVDENFVKRPLNSFMLYRKDKQHDVPTNNHQSISRIIGDMWRKEAAEVKAHYDQLAKEERERHALQYPGYKFQPRPTKKDKGKEKKADKPMLKTSTSKSSLRDAQSRANSVCSDFGTPSVCPPHPMYGTSRPPVQPYYLQRQDSQQHHYYMKEDNIYNDRAATLPMEYAHYSTRLDCFSEDSLASSGLNPTEQARKPGGYDPALVPGTDQPYSAFAMHGDWNNAASDLSQVGTKSIHFTDAPLYQRVSALERLYLTDDNIGLSGMGPPEATYADEDFYSYQFRCHDTQAEYVPSLTTGSWELETELQARQFDF